MGSTENTRPEDRPRERPWLCLLLVYALVRGLLQIALVPPWQHYDEPTHFEYAWLIANRQALPQPGDYDGAMRREVAASMLEHGFYRGSDSRPYLLIRDEPGPIGVSELHHPPFYYLLAALPLRLLRHADVVLQLYVGRSVSLMLHLLSVWVGGQLVAELAPQGHPLRWAVPAMMALLPAYADLMTAINNDVGATALFSLFLWGAVRLVLRGVSTFHLIWVVSTAALCLWTKNTVAVAILLAPLVLLLSLWRRPWGRRAWTGLVGSGLLLVGAVFSWGDAALWYRSTTQAVSTRQEMEESPLGRAALVLEATTEDPRRQIVQPLLREDVDSLRGRTVTLGAWMWAAQPIQIRSPMLYDGQQGAWRPVEVGTTPAFHAVTTTVSASADRIEVILRPLLGRNQEGAVAIYYDGLVLAEGEWALAGVPDFNGPEGWAGTWGGGSFVNWVRNGSIEAAWPRVRPWVEKVLHNYTRRSGAQFLASLLDWQRTGWVYRSSGVNLLQSFWARFGWNHVGLGGAWYWGLVVVTGVGMIGAVVGLVRLWRSGRPLSVKRATGLLALAGLLVWGNAFLRPHPVMARPFIPAARYTYPVIVPTVLVLMGGWLSLVPQRGRKWAVVTLLSGLVLLDVVSLATVVLFYYGG